MHARVPLMSEVTLSICWGRGAQGRSTVDYNNNIHSFFLERIWEFWRRLLFVSLLVVDVLYLEFAGD